LKIDPVGSPKSGPPLANGIFCTAIAQVQVLGFGDVAEMKRAQIEEVNPAGVVYSRC
jgi:hypothetical protein